jgi:hypothetical protein
MAIPAAAQALIIVGASAVVLGAVFLLWWSLQCRPTKCRIWCDAYWIFSWVLQIGLIIFFFAPQVIPILAGLGLLLNAIILPVINSERDCRAHSIFIYLVIDIFDAGLRNLLAISNSNGPKEPETN